MPGRFRLASALILGLAASIIMPASSAQAAWAPSGCSPYGYNSWNDQCFLGENESVWDSRGEFVVATQRILRANGFYPGPGNDGIYGAQTAQAVRQYQDSSAVIGTTGIVTDVMWAHMENYKIRVGPAVDGWVNITVPPGTNWVFRRPNFSDTYAYWYARTASNSQWVDFDANGPRP